MTMADQAMLRLHALADSVCVRSQHILQQPPKPESDRKEYDRQSYLAWKARHDTR